MPLKSSFVVLKVALMAALVSACSTLGNIPLPDFAKQESSEKPVSPSPVPSSPVPPSPVLGQYAVASANPHATQAGLDILAQGGTAIDAAIAVQAVLSLVEPQSSGLAGGAFLVHYDPATDDVITYDGREVAPASATAEMFLKADGTAMDFYDAQRSPQSVGVPGVVAMLDLAHREHGSLPWSTSLAPALALATHGFDVSPLLHRRLTEYDKLKTSAAARAHYFQPDGTPWPVGHTLKTPEYAATLTALSQDGPKAFYSGKIAADIINTVNIAAGVELLTEADFQSYRPVKRAAVCGTYGGKRLCSMGPPSSGGVTVLEILNILSHTDFAATAPASAASWHLLIEASRLAYADRNIYLGDPDYMQIGHITAEDIVAALTSDTYAKQRAAAISPDQAMATVSAGDPTAQHTAHNTTQNIEKRTAHSSQEPVSTSHFTVLDAQGRVVSMTTTVESIFGSHLYSGGMILNNQLTDFSFLPTKGGAKITNAAAPGKRPRSSMSPTIMFNEDGSVYGAVGSPGGGAIIGYVTKALIGLIEWDLSVQDAIDLPNIVFPYGTVQLEKGRVSAEIQSTLKALGHTFVVEEEMSGLHGFIIRDGRIEGGADKRKEGTFATGKSAE